MLTFLINRTKINYVNISKRISLKNNFLKRKNSKIMIEFYL